MNFSISKMLRSSIGSPSPMSPRSDGLSLVPKAAPVSTPSNSRKDLYMLKGSKSTQGIVKKQRETFGKRRKDRKSELLAKSRPGLEEVMKNIDEEPEEQETPGPSKPVRAIVPRNSKKETLLERLQKWKEEKKRKRTMNASVKKPPFKVGVYKLDSKVMPLNVSGSLIQKWSTKPFFPDKALQVKKGDKTNQRAAKSQEPSNISTTRFQVSRASKTKANVVGPSNPKKSKVRSNNNPGAKRLRKVLCEEPDEASKIEEEAIPKPVPVIQLNEAADKVEESQTAPRRSRRIAVAAKKSLRFANESTHKDAMKIMFESPGQTTLESPLIPIQATETKTFLTPKMASLKIISKRESITPLRRSARLSQLYANDETDDECQPPSILKKTSVDTPSIQEPNIKSPLFKPNMSLNFNFAPDSLKRKSVVRFSASKPKDYTADEDNNRDEEGFATPKSTRKLIRKMPSGRRKSEAGFLLDALRHDVDFKRGSTSDKKQLRRGINPYANTSKDWGLIDLIPDDSDSPVHLQLKNLFLNESAKKEDQKLTPELLREKVDQILNSEKRKSAMFGRNFGSELKEAEMEEENDVPYFRNLLKTETQRLEGLCAKWEEKLQSQSETIGEECSGQVRANIGKARLLMNRKGRFEQFSDLVDNCEFKRGDKITTCMDLQGFWDMIYFQIENVDKGFNDLDDLEGNNWVQKQEEENKKPKLKLKRKKVATTGNPPMKRNKNVKVSQSLKELMAAKRQEMKDPSLAGKVQKLKSDEKELEGGFFKVRSPLRKITPKSTNKTTTDSPLTSGTLKSSLRVQKLNMDDL